MDSTTVLSTSIIVSIYDIVIKMGLYDTQLALIIVYAAVNMPFVMWTMRVGVRGLPDIIEQGIPKSLDEAAFMDGATSLETFIKVILPICVPGLLRRLSLVSPL